MKTDLTRRAFLTGTAGAAGLTLAAAPAPAQDAAPRFQKGVSPWAICMNASTIRPANVKTKIDATAKAGWDAIELWITDLEAHEKDGGSLKDLGKEIIDRGMFVPNIIGLWECMPMDDEAFKKSLEATRERMRRCSEVGSHFVAAIPAPDTPDFDLKTASARYRELMRTIDQTLASLEGATKMDEKAMYRGFDPKQQDAYEKELVEKHGAPMQGHIDHAKKGMAGWKQGDFDAMQAEAEAIEAAMAKALVDGLRADAAAVTALMARQHAWVSKGWNREAPLEAFAGLGQMYVDDPRFRARYDGRQPGLAEYMAAAMKAYADAAGG